MLLLELSSEFWLAKSAKDELANYEANGKSRTIDDSANVPKQRLRRITLEKGRAGPTADEVIHQGFSAQKSPRVCRLLGGEQDSVA